MLVTVSLETGLTLEDWIVKAVNGNLNGYIHIQGVPKKVGLVFDGPYRASKVD